MSYLSFYVNCYIDGSAMWEYSVYDSGGAYIASMSINSTVTNEFLEFNYPDMKRLEIRGTGNWAEYHTIDDIMYVCEDSPTPTPTNTSPPTATPTPLTCDILWDQPLSTVNTNAYVSQEFTDFPTYSAYAADDFTNTETWYLAELFVPGGLWNGGTILDERHGSDLATVCGQCRIS